MTQLRCFTRTEIQDYDAELVSDRRCGADEHDQTHAHLQQRIKALEGLSLRHTGTLTMSTSITPYDFGELPLFTKDQATLEYTAQQNCVLSMSAGVHAAEQQGNEYWIAVDHNTGGPHFTYLNRDLSEVVPFSRQHRAQREANNVYVLAGERIRIVFRYVAGTNPQRNIRVVANVKP